MKTGTQEIEKICDKIKTATPESKIYLGCDSIRRYRHGRLYIKYATVVIIHYDGKHGGDVMGFIDEDPNCFDQMKKPITRLMNEAYRVSDLYLKLKDAIGDRHVEIHLDINPNPAYASNLVYNQAIGVVRSLCDKEAHTKPTAFAASICADFFLS